MHSFMKRALEMPSSYSWYTSSRSRTRSATKRIKPQQQIDHLADLLETDRSDLAADIKRLGLMKKAAREECPLNVAELQKRGFSNRTIIDYIHIICMRPSLLRTRLQICEEVGCPLIKTPPIVLNFYKFLHAQIPLLRGYGVIVDPTFEGLIQRLLNHLDLEAEQLCEEIQRNYEIIDIYKALYNTYLFLNVPVLKNIPGLLCKAKRKRDHVTSLQNFRANVKFLTEVLEFNTDEMVKYKSLLFNNYDDNVSLLHQLSDRIQVKDLIPDSPELMDVIKDRRLI